MLKRAATLLCASLISAPAFAHDQLAEHTHMGAVVLYAVPLILVATAALGGLVYLAYTQSSPRKIRRRSDHE